MRVSLTVKVSLLVAALVIGLMAGVYGTSSRALSEPLVANLLKKGESLAGNLAANCREAVLNGDELLLASFLDQVKREPGFLYAVVLDAEGRVLAHSDLSVKAGTRPAGLDAAVPSETVAVTRITSGSLRGHQFAAAMSAKGNLLGSVRIALSEDEIVAAQAAFRGTLVAVAGGALLLGLIGAALLGRLLTSPIHRIAEAARQVGSGNLSARTGLTQRDELGDLARTFDRMTEQIGEAQKALREQERLQSEMEVARAIQAALVPRASPKIPGFELASVYRPARDVSGDYFDYFPLDDKHLGIVVADVCGKGVGAALMMVSFRTQLRYEARASLSPAQVLSRVNAHMSEESPEGQFITVAYGVLDTAKRRLTLASAGHTPVLTVRPGAKTCDALSSHCLPLCSPWPDHFERRIQDQELALPAGTSCFLYTDGVTDAANPGQEIFGEERFSALLCRAAAKRPAAAMEALLRELDAFTAGAPQADDVTVVALQAL